MSGGGANAHVSTDPQDLGVAYPGKGRAAMDAFPDHGYGPMIRRGLESLAQRPLDSNGRVPEHGDAKSSAEWPSPTTSGMLHGTLQALCDRAHQASGAVR